jgi:hypothetical protein
MADFSKLAALLQAGKVPSQEDADAANQALQQADLNRSGGQIVSDLLARGADAQANYDNTGFPKNPAHPSDYTGGADPAASSVDPNLGPNGPSLFARVTGAIKNQQDQGNVGPSPSLLANRSPAIAKSTPSDVQDAIKTAQAAPATNPNDPYGKELGDAALKAAQEKAKQINAASLMARASSTMAEALSKGAYKDNSGFADALAKTADADEKNILQRRAAADQDLNHQKQVYELATDKDKNDPNSAVSKMSRDILQQMSNRVGMKLGNIDNMSVASLEKIYGPLERYFGMVEASENRKAAAADKKTQRDSAEVLKYNKIMGEDLDPNRARSGALGKSQQVINDTQALEALAHNYTNLDKVPPAQYAEMAGALDRLISRGNPSVERFKHLMPSNAALTGNTILQSIQSKPTGAGQGEFIKSILQTASQERKTAQQQILDGQLKKAYSTHNEYKKRHPDEFYNTLSGATGLSIDELKDLEKNKGKSPTASQSSSDLSDQDKQAIEWAKANKGDPRSDQILKMHGLQ